MLHFAVFFPFFFLFFIGVIALLERKGVDLIVNCALRFFSFLLLLVFLHCLIRSSGVDDFSDLIIICALFIFVIIGVIAFLRCAANERRVELAVF